MSKNTLEVLELVFALGEATGQTLEDSQVTLSDSAYFFDVLGKIMPAVRDITLVDNEIAAWTDADTADAIALAQNFDIPQDDIEQMVKDALKFVAELVGFLSKFRRD